MVCAHTHARTHTLVLVGKVRIFEPSFVLLASEVYEDRSNLLPSIILSKIIIINV